MKRKLYEVTVTFPEGSFALKGNFRVKAISAEEAEKVGLTGMRTSGPNGKDVYPIFASAKLV